MSEEEKKLNYCMSCNKKYDRESPTEAFYYVMNDTKLDKNKDIMVGILCDVCWNKEEESYRKITGFWEGKEPNKPIGVRKEDLKDKVLSFIVYNWNTRKWMYILDAQGIDLGSPNDVDSDRQTAKLPNWNLKFSN